MKKTGLCFPKTSGTASGDREKKWRTADWCTLVYPKVTLLSSLRKQTTFRDISSDFPVKGHLRNKCRNSILMMHHYPDLASASDWSCCMWNLPQPIISTTQIWVVACYQYGISALVSQTLFHDETVGDVAKRCLFSQAMLSSPLIFLKWQIYLC